MKNTYVNTLKKGQKGEEFFMVKSIAIKTDKNLKKYLDIYLGDKTGEISAKKWHLNQDDEVPTLEKIKQKDVVKVSYTINDYNGQTQLQINNIIVADEGTWDPEDFIKEAPESSEDMYSYVLNIAENFTDEDLKAICIKVLTENREKLLYYPAAQKNHHAEYGGLLYHTKRMIMTGEGVCQVYTNLNKDLVLAGVILHDMEKINEIDAQEDGVATGYSFEGQLLGHIVQGVKSIDRMSAELNIPREKAIMLEHMILAHHYEPEYGSPKKPLFPEAEVLHYLDILDARMYDMENALSSTEEGEFSDKVWTLDNRKLYKRKFD